MFIDQTECGSFTCLWIKWPAKEKKRREPDEVPATTTLISSNTNHSIAVTNSAEIGDNSGRILSRVESGSAHPRTTITERLASAREWVSRAQRRLGLSTSQPSLPAPSSPSSSQAMLPSSVVWARFDMVDRIGIEEEGARRSKRKEISMGSALRFVIVY